MDFLALAGRVILSLAVVLVLLWLAARTMRKNQRRTSRGVDVDVLARQPLARSASVAVVKVGDRALVLGVTESRVELLADHPVASLMLADAIAESEDGADLPTEVTPAPVVGNDATVAVPPQRKVSQPATGPLAGSALSPATWSKALDAVREMTVRK
ncbi:flagellar biosynthetic protein FliO [Angustibacter luteus]|uniref:Flagellar biosynthetic protein FliO n=1 Tax=Angustibacter luteus TaxID=658456 RepID=A0ABW1JHR0_9ACTN